MVGDPLTGAYAASGQHLQLLPTPLSLLAGQLHGTKMRAEDPWVALGTPDALAAARLRDENARNMHLQTRPIVCDWVHVLRTTVRP